MRVPEPVANLPHPSRWRLFLSCLPVAFALTVLKLSLEPVIGFKGVIEFNSDLNVIFTALVFIMGFILAGTIVDFKEAERLPGEIACQLEIMEDWFVEASVIAERTTGYPPTAPARRDLLEAVRTSTYETLGWLRSDAKRSEDIFPAVKRLDEQIKRMEQAGLDKITVRMLGDINQLRRGVTRAYTISRTEFMGPAYALFEFFIAFIFLLLLACSFKTPVVAGVVTSFMGLTYWYLYRLIRDIDNPFDFGKGHTEVSLQPLERYAIRIDKRVASLAAPPAASAAPPQRDRMPATEAASAT
jgi:hypothetical protein